MGGTSKGRKKKHEGSQSSSSSSSSSSSAHKRKKKGRRGEREDGVPPGVDGMPFGCGGFPGYPGFFGYGYGAGFPGGYPQYPGMPQGCFPGYPGYMPGAGGIPPPPPSLGQAALMPPTSAPSAAPLAAEKGRHPGDWTCPQCNDLVFASRKECRRCGTPAPPGRGADGRGFSPGRPLPANSQKAMPGDWVCPKCRDLQFARNRTCRMCGTEKPATAERPFLEELFKRRSRSRSRSRSF